MKTTRFLSLAIIFAVLMSASSANALEPVLLEAGAKWVMSKYAESKEIREKMQEIQPTYNDWIKFLEDYISKTGKIGDCKTIGFRDLSNNRAETQNFSYECGIDGDIAFLSAKNKVKIGKCEGGSVFKAEFDIKKNYLETRSFPRNDACVFFQPSCRTFIGGFCPENMVFVGGGTFSMGCSNGRRDFSNSCDYNEEPTHYVTVNSFCIGKHEVTQKEWQEVMGSNPSKFQNCGGNCPVEQVSWNDIQTFISKLNAKTGMNYRLPTEAEWEYAARGGCKGMVEMIKKDVVNNEPWYSKNSNKQTHPVGTKQPNSLGIYDMSGNVWEWVNDWYGKYSESSVDNPKGPSNGSQKIARGGSWSSTADRCRVTARAGDPPNTRKDISGFRLVHSPTDKAALQKINTDGGGKTKEEVLQNFPRPSGKGGFNAGYAEGGPGGLDGELGGLMGDSGSIGIKSRGGVKAPDEKNIVSSGTRSKTEIMAVANQRVNGLKSIYNRYLKNKPGFAGKVTLKFTIVPSGDITTIGIVSSTTDYPEFDKAIKDQVFNWKWKQIASGNTTATIPFNFSE